LLNHDKRRRKKQWSRVEEEIRKEQDDPENDGVVAENELVEPASCYGGGRCGSQIDPARVSVKDQRDACVDKEGKE
jgi:hypothetical protein